MCTTKPYGRARVSAFSNHAGLYYFARMVWYVCPHGSVWWTVAAVPTRPIVHRRAPCSRKSFRRRDSLSVLFFRMAGESRRLRSHASGGLIRRSCSPRYTAALIPHDEEPLPRPPLKSLHTGAAPQPVQQKRKIQHLQRHDSRAFTDDISIP